MSEAVEQTKPSGIPTPADLGFDPAVLRAEVCRRARRSVCARTGTTNTRKSPGSTRTTTTDPYVDAGLHAARAARRARRGDRRRRLRRPAGRGAAAGGGITNIRIIEKAGDFGGTWYWNRYPGAQCDIESYCYLPLLEETGYMPKEKYSFAPEIFEHAQRIGKHFDLYENACFQTQITEARWDEDAGRWTVTTDRDDVFKARFVDHVERAR